MVMLYAEILNFKNVFQHFSEQVFLLAGYYSIKHIKSMNEPNFK